MSAITNLALQGIQRGLQNASRHSHQVITAFSVADRDPTEPIVALSQDLHAVRASAKLIKLDQSLDRAILDILA